MKALRYLLITFAVMMVMSVSAQSLAQEPQIGFQSTSSMVGSGSTLPQAALEGPTTTYETGFPGRSGAPGIKKIGGNTTGGSDDREDPYENPIGDGVWALLFCAAVFSGVIAFRRKRQQRNV